MRFVVLRAFSGNGKDWSVGEAVSIDLSDASEVAHWRNLKKLQDQGYLHVLETPSSSGVTHHDEDLEPNRRGPTAKSKGRACLYKKIKDGHPEWGYDAVANRANDVDKERLVPHSAETVRNAYRAMKQAGEPGDWDWERADRVR